MKIDLELTEINNITIIADKVIFSSFQVYGILYRQTEDNHLFSYLLNLKYQDYIFKKCSVDSIYMNTGDYPTYTYYVRYSEIIRIKPDYLKNKVRKLKRLLKK